MSTRQLIKERLQLLDALNALITAAENAPDAVARTALLEALTTNTADKRKELAELAHRQVQLSGLVASLEKRLDAARKQEKVKSLRKERLAARVSNNQKLLELGKAARTNYLSQIAALTSQIEALASTPKTTVQLHRDPMYLLPDLPTGIHTPVGCCAPPTTDACDSKAVARAAANLFHRRQAELSAARRELRALRESNETLQSQIETLHQGGSGAEALFNELQRSASVA